MGHIWHLVRRFFGSLVPFGPAAADAQWAEGQLLAGEVALWQRMSRPDRRHSIAVAQRAALDLGPDATRPVLAAALLHDVGKVESGFGTGRRVVATVAVKVAGRDRARDWVGADGFRRRIGLYADHPDLGAALLEQAGSDPLTITWAREHHLPEARWTLPRRTADALKAADDD